MASPIRPSFVPTQPSAPSAPGAAARAAQRAFFDAALGKAAAPAASVGAPAIPAMASRPAQATPAPVRLDLDQPAPARVLRPGSLVDIKV